MRHNGILLGKNSPLLSLSGARRLLAPTEADEQIALMELLVGPAVKGRPRDPAGGMIPKHPELYLITALNPNKGGRRPAAAGIAKAMGMLAGLPDLHLPVMRGPFLSLYVELKRRGEKERPSQSALHERLRAEGHCVLVASGAEGGLSVILGYLALPRNRVSGRPVPRHLLGLTTITERVARWREECYEILTTREGL